MKEFIDKLIGRLEEYKYSHLVERDIERLEHCKEKEMDCEGSDCFLCVWDKATEIVNQLAEEHNNESVKTNADYIRNMTDDELAELLYGIGEFWDDGEGKKFINGVTLHDGKDDILDWLQSEAETKGE